MNEKSGNQYVKETGGVVYATGLTQVQTGASQVFNNLEHSIVQTL